MARTAVIWPTYAAFGFIDKHIIKTTTMNKENLVKIGKGMLIAAGAGAATYFFGHYTEIDLGENTVVFQAVISVLIVAIKEYFKTRPQLEEIDSLPTDGYDD